MAYFDFVQGTTRSSATGGSAVSRSLSVTAGNTLFWHVNYYDSPFTPTADPSDGVNDWSNFIQDGDYRLYWAIAQTTATITVSQAASSGGRIAADLIEREGSSVLDVSNTQRLGSPGSPYNYPSITTTGPDRHIVFVHLLDNSVTSGPTGLISGYDSANQYDGIFFKAWHGAGYQASAGAMATTQFGNNATVIYAITAAFYEAGAAPVVAGTVTAVAQPGGTSVKVDTTVATAGVPSYTYQFQRAPDSGGSPGTFANIGSASAARTYLDTGRTPGTKYHYRVVVTDSTPGTPTTDTSASVVVRMPAVYYVDNAGSDSNTGLSGSPWLTADKVTSYGLFPGDDVRFTSAQTHTGQLTLASIQASFAMPVKIRTTARARAIIDCGDDYALKATDCPYLWVQKIKGLGSGVSLSGTLHVNRTATYTSAAPGFWFTTSADADYIRGTRIDDCEVEGCLEGITIETVQEATKGFDQFSITRTLVHRCITVGIHTHSYSDGTPNYQRPGQFMFNFIVQDCEVHHIVGDSSTANSGHGIVSFNMGSSRFERCYIHENAEAAGTASSTGGPGAIVPVACLDVVFSEIEADTIYSPSGDDGIALDIDANCEEVRYERCYARNCDGPGMLAWQVSTSTSPFLDWKNNGWFNCIIENCGRANQAGGFRAGASSEDIGDFVADAYVVQNCTFYHDKVGGAATPLLSTSKSGKFINNIFIVKGGATFGALANGTTMAGNLYHVMSGSSFSLDINSVNYTSLADMQVDGYEMLDDFPIGYEGDSLLQNPGGGFAQWVRNGTPTTLRAYDPLVTSTVFNGAINPLRITTAVWAKSPAVDFHGLPIRKVPNDLDFVQGGYTFGAVSMPQPAKRSNRGMRG